MVVKGERRTWIQLTREWLDRLLEVADRKENESERMRKDSECDGVERKAFEVLEDGLLLRD